MKKQIILLFSLSLILVISGCVDSPVGKVVGLGPSCPDSCNDEKICTKDFCSEATDFICKNELIKPCNGNGICESGEFLKSSDCPTCDDRYSCTKDSYDYNTHSCIHIETAPCCGNAICERFAGESHGSCSSDCDMTKEEATRNCKKYDTEWRIERCLSTIAVNYKDVGICNEIINLISNYECVAQVAIQLNQVSLCKNINTNNYLLGKCVTNYAKENGDYYACLITDNILNQIDCFESVYVASNKYKIAPCSGLEGDANYICLAVVNNDKEYCNNIVNETKVFSCSWYATPHYYPSDVQDVRVVN